VKQRSFRRTALTAIFFVANATVSHAQSQYVPPPPVVNPSAPLTLPAPSEMPVSPTNPGTLPGTTSALGPAIGTNPITGLPCTGEGSSSAVAGSNTLPGTSSPAGDNQVGLPSTSSVYGEPNESELGAC
jgi:hypothetical protein